jgi:DNA-binding NarL/FixJ family response regulator
MAIRIHLADDHTMFRQGLESILASREEIEVVGTSSSSGPDAVARIAETKPDVIVTQLDMDLGTVEGILGRLREASPGSRIVVLTLWDNARYLKAVAGMGIDALIHKSSSAEDLAAVVEAASLRPGGGGNTVVSLPRAFLERMDAGTGGLTDRQTEIVVLAARGFSNREIAEELHLAPATVKRHLANVYENLGVGSRNDAVRRALEEQWIGIHEIIYPSADGDGSSDGSRG